MSGFSKFEHLESERFFVYKSFSMFCLYHLTILFNMYQFHVYQVLMGLKY